MTGCGSACWGSNQYARRVRRPWITLSRKPEGLRMALLNPKEDWVRELNARKVYLGRRMYFPVEVVASLLNGEQAAQENGG